MATRNYLKDIRGKVGNMPILLNFGAVCVVDDEGRILLQQRDREGQQWGFPGGALEYGESFEEAAVREVKEETGVDVALEGMVGLYDKYFAKYPNGDEAQTVVVFYLGRPVGGELVVDQQETFNLRWFTVSDVPQLFNQQHQDMLADYLKNMPNNHV